MNYANIEKSLRLQKVITVLKDKKWHSTMDIIKRAEVCAVNSIITELRLNGFDIQCKRDANKWLYQLQG
jgi:hypothetical protein